MRITIILEDQENGHVKLDCRPPIQQLIKAWKGGDITPALTYAVLGINAMQSDSNQIGEAMEKDSREEEMMRSGLVLPWKPNKPDGPQEVFQ
jgi:hypothetical protein